MLDKLAKCWRKFLVCCENRIPKIGIAIAFLIISYPSIIITGYIGYFVFQLCSLDQSGIDLIVLVISVSTFVLAKMVELYFADKVSKYSFYLFLQYALDAMTPVLFIFGMLHFDVLWFFGVNLISCALLSWSYSGKMMALGTPPSELRKRSLKLNKGMKGSKVEEVLGKVKKGTINKRLDKGKKINPSGYTMCHQ